MIQIGKTAQKAIAVVSYLAECYRDESEMMNSQKIADARDLSKSLVAKILTTLAQQGCVTGSTGPGGGYKLSRKPSEITLYEVASCFELKNNKFTCPFGENYCSSGNKVCPLHDSIVELNERMHQFLTENDFGGFATSEISARL